MLPGSDSSVRGTKIHSKKQLFLCWEKASTLNIKLLDNRKGKRETCFIGCCWLFHTAQFMKQLSPTGKRRGLEQLQATTRRSSPNCCLCLPRPRSHPINCSLIYSLIDAVRTPMLPLSAPLCHEVFISFLANRLWFLFSFNESSWQWWWHDRINSWLLVSPGHLQACVGALIHLRWLNKRDHPAWGSSMSHIPQHRPHRAR